MAYKLVPEGTPDHDFKVLPCKECGEKAVFQPQSVMYFSTAGARRLKLWSCEKHPLPDMVNETDEGNL
jgi:hypothetical protein